MVVQSESVFIAHWNRPAVLRKEEDVIVLDYDRIRYIDRRRDDSAFPNPRRRLLFVWTHRTPFQRAKWFPPVN